MGRVAHRIVSPVQGAVDSVASPVSDWWNGVTDGGNLKRRNRELEEENARLRGKQVVADQAIKENADLKASLASQNALLSKNVTANVVGREPGNFDPTLTIDKGSEAGISVDMPVIGSGGVVVGKVLEVWKGGAKIQVLTDPAFSVGVQTPGHGPGAPPTTGVASGQVGSHDLAVQFDGGTRVAQRPDCHVAAVDVVPRRASGRQDRDRGDQPGNTGVNATITPYVKLGALQHVTVLLWSPGTPGPVLPPPPTTTTSTSTTSTTTTTVAGG